MGSNDYLNKYLLPNYPNRNHYNGQQFADLLPKDLGAQKFVLAGIGLMGCIPSILAQGMAGKCLEDVNQLVRHFKSYMRTMTNNISTNLPGSKFVFIDVHNMFDEMPHIVCTKLFLMLLCPCCYCNSRGSSSSCYNGIVFATSHVSIWFTPRVFKQSISEFFTGCIKEVKSS